MDNLTHSLFGVALAETAYQVAQRRSQTPQSPQSRRPFYYGSIIANNFPDLDLVMRFFDSSPLAFLVHHRGYSHTLIWALPQALFVFLVVQWKQKEKLLLFLLCVVGVLTHMLLDYQNSYGIHMFSPFDHHWLYDDTLFIVEPTLWIPALALGFLTWTSKTIKLVLFIFFLAVLALVFNLGVINVAGFSIMGALLAAAYLVMRDLKPMARAILTLGAMLAVIGIFRIYKAEASREISKELGKNGIAPVIDLVMSPMPTHPTCWTFYRVDAGVHGLDCPLWTPMELDLRPSPIQDSAGFRWLGMYTNSKQKLIADYDSDCRVQTFYQFVRVPARDNNVLSDLRFGGNRSFSAVFLNEKSECPKFPTPWIPPRQDLLNAQ